MRKIQFQNNEYYHIYNRGVDKRNIFMDEKDYLRFLVSMREFNIVEPIGSLFLQKFKKEREKGLLRGATPKNLGVAPLNKPLVDILCYCLNSNHFHLILKQLENKGISEFMKRLSGGYTCYFNKKYERSGYLFQGKYKSIHINSSDYLLQLSCYINGNPEIHKIAKAESYQWSSYLDYLEKRNGTLCNKKIILNEFENINEYKNLVNSIIEDSSIIKEEMKKIFLEEKI